MQTLFLILADGAKVAEGKLYMLGGGWTKITPPILPSKHLTHLAIGIKAAWDETDERHIFVLRLEAPSGQVREIAGGEFQMGRPADVPEGSEQTLLLAMPLIMQLGEQPGRYVVTLSVDGEELGSTYFLAAQRP